MRKVTSGAIAVLLAGAGLAFTAAPASAHTPAASATCEAITISASNYETKPASGEPTIANPDYQPAVPGTPAVGEPTIVIDNPDYVPAKDAVTATEYLYKQLITGKTKWLDSLTWNPGLGWYYAGETREVEVTPAQPAVGEPQIEVDNPAYVPAVPEVPAVGEPTIPNPEYVEADETPNTVAVTVDGATTTEEFGTDYSAVVPFENKYVAHDWSVTITAWNDPSGDRGYTQTYSGTTTPCDLPIVPASHSVTGEATCGAADITLSNEQGEYEQALTASFVIWVDGDFHSAPAVMGGESKTVSLAFDEDSGDHQIIVRSGPAQGDEVLLTLDVTSDCETNVPPTEEPEEPTTPTTPEEPKVDEPAAQTPVTARLVTTSTDDTLAQTGADPAVTVWGLTAGALAVALGALSVVFGLRRRQMNQQ